MKFYKRFPGDITIKTGHLTPSQFGCYDRLLDHYYATEKPIPANGAYSICRAVTPADRHACDSVLGEFFVLTGAGWEQQRAEEMIAEALPRIEAAKANGKLGGRPKGSIKKPTGLILETQGATQTADLQKGSQSQSSSLRSEVSKTSSSHPPAGGFADFWLTWPKSERKQDKAKCLEHWQRHCLAAIAETIIADVRVKHGTTKWSEGYIESPLVYLRNKRWEDGVEPDNGKPGEAVVDWRDGPAPGIIARGIELGCGDYDPMKEQWYPYRARVFAAADAAEAATPPARLKAVA